MRSVQALLLLVSVVGVGCGDQPTAMASSASTGPLPSSTRPNTPANPWPRFQLAPMNLRAVPPTVAVVEPVQPRPVVTDLLQRLAGTWVYRSTPPANDPQSVKECRMIFRANGRGTETCTDRWTPSPEEQTCSRARRGLVERTTASPYTVTVLGQSLLFTPGRGRVVRNTTCEAIDDPNHIPVRGGFVGENELVLYALNPQGEPTSTSYRYFREPTAR